MQRVMLVALVATVPALASAQAIYTGPGSYTQSGKTTYGPNGSTQQHVGQFTYVNPGNGQPSTPYQRIGPNTYGSDGSSHRQAGQFGYGNDGTTTQTIGKFTYIHKPDGTTVTCQKIGAQTNCD